MTISTDFRRKMILKLIEALKESPAFTNLSLDQIKEAVLNSEHQTYQQSKSSEEYLFYINEKLKKIKQSGNSGADSVSDQISVEAKEEKSKMAGGGMPPQGKMPQMYSQEPTSTVASVRKMNNFSSSFESVKRQQENNLQDPSYESQAQKASFVKAEYRNSPGLASFNNNSYQQYNKPIDHEQTRPRYQNNFDPAMKADLRHSYANPRYQGSDIRSEASNMYTSYSSAVYGGGSQFINEDIHMPETFQDKRNPYQSSRQMPPHQPFQESASYKFEGFNPRFGTDMHSAYAGIPQNQYGHDSRSIPVGHKSPFPSKELFNSDPYLDKKIQSQIKSGGEATPQFMDGPSEIGYKTSGYSQNASEFKPFINNDVIGRSNNNPKFANQSMTPPTLNTFTKKAVSYEYSYPKASAPTNNKSFIGNVNPTLYDHAMKKAETENYQGTQRPFTAFESVPDIFSQYNRNNSSYSKAQSNMDNKQSEELFRSFGSEFLKINKNQDLPKSLSQDESIAAKSIDNKSFDSSNSLRFIAMQDSFSHNVPEEKIEEPKPVDNTPAELQEYLNKNNISLKPIKNLEHWNTLFDRLYNKYKRISTDKIGSMIISHIDMQKQHINFQFLDEEDIQRYIKEMENVENTPESTFDRTEYLKFIDKAIEAFSEKQNEELCSFKNNENNI